MMMPAFGSRPVKTSQYSRFVFTPVPSGDGQVISAGAIVGLRAGGAGFRVVRRVCASSEPTIINTASAATMAHRRWTMAD